jgi:hypothetical protein
MILPAKHIKFSQSLLGLAGFILGCLKQPMSVDEIWIKFSKTSKTKFPGYHDFDNIVLATNLLFLLGTIEIDRQGKLHNAIN